MVKPANYERWRMPPQLAAIRTAAVSAAATDVLARADAGDADHRVDGLGSWIDGPEFLVDARQTTAYAAATGDANPWHVDGRLAPPVFAVPPAIPAAEQALTGLVGPELLSSFRGVHGEHDLTIHRPIEPGTVIYPRAMAIGVRRKPTGTIVIVRAEDRSNIDELLNEQFFTFFIRGAQASESVGELAPLHALPAGSRESPPVAEVVQQLAPNQSHLYADASGDHTGYHVDDDAARSAGFPSVIVHGLCTMAFTSAAAIASFCADDPRRLRRLAVRFSHPVIPGQTLTTRFWDRTGKHSDGSRRLGFETRDSSNRVVVRHGLVDVGRPVPG